MHCRLTLLSTLLITGVLSAQTPEAQQSFKVMEERVAPIRALLASERNALGLNEKHNFSLKSVVPDEHGDQIIRFHQTFQGLRVWGGETIVLADANGAHKGEKVYSVRPVSDLNVTPTLQSSEAIELFNTRLEVNLQPSDDEPLAQSHIMTRTMDPDDEMGLRTGPRKPVVRMLSKPTAELLVYPIMRQVRIASAVAKAEHELLATDMEDVVDRVALAYYVQIRRVVNGKTSFQDALVDAHSGEVLSQWNALQTGNVKGIGKTLYSGTVELDVNQNGSIYEMRDVVRATSPQFNVTPSNSSTVYTSTSTTFGNGTTSDTKSVAADALWGVQATYDALYNCFNWRGVNNANAGLNVKVHLNEDNAYFDGGNTITFGDGISYFKPLLEMDVVAHEYGHAVCQATANLTYSGESGGLNEANSDIQGTFVEFYAAGGKTGNVIPASGGDWVLGAKISKDGNPLRWMYKPSKDGKSPDIWSSTLGNIDVHYSSGPANRMFYFLSQGSTASGDYYSSKLTYGPMTGIGIHKAANIWFKALTTKMTSSTKYAAAYTACKSAAEQLYGVGSPEAVATTRAFAAIAVTSDVPQGVSVSITPTTASVKTGATYQFSASVVGSSNTAVTWTATGGTVSTSGLYTAPTTTGTYTVKATSAADTTKSASATVTVSPATGVSVAITPTTSTIQTGATQQFTASVTGSTNTAVTWTATGGTVSTSGLYTAPATAGTYTVKATSAADTTKSASATVTVTTGGGEKILNGGFESGATSWAGTTGVIGNWNKSPYYEVSYEGLNAAFLGGNGATSTETLYQSVAIPSTATRATLSFYLHIGTKESGTTVYDKLAVQVRNSAGTLLKTLATYSNANAASGYQVRTFDLSAYKGQTVRVHFNMTEDQTLATNFLVDKVSLTVQ
ncbi:MAG: M4 family metallopeptidase [Holophaga sp.]|nr:M4 family metallopeptidase [Holophaga sp.]